MNTPTVDLAPEVDWLLEESNPAVRHMALRLLLKRPPYDPDVRSAREAAMRAEPIASILAAQHPEGYWDKPGPGYAHKYTGTVWQVMFLDQLGADPAHPQVRAACEYLLAHTAAAAGGFGASGSHIDTLPPPPSSVIHCLNGNLVRALIGFGYLDDERVRASIDWEARSITGEGFEERYHFYRSGTSGPGFECAANDHLPCAWGAVKALLALARIPEERREPHVQRALEQAAALLLSTDPTVAAYPTGWGNTKPSLSWYKLGFPSGYVTDVLQTLQAICEAGYATHPQMQGAVEWLLNKRTKQGVWKNDYAYTGKTVVNFEPQGAPSKWVTLRALHVLEMLR